MIMGISIEAELQDIVDLLNGPGSPVDFIVDDKNAYEAVESLIDKYDELNDLLDSIQSMVS